MNGLNFTSIGFVADKGVAGTSSYSFTDDKLVSGVNYYRIKEVDNDGRFMYSSIQKINFSHFAWKINCNPVNNSSVDVMPDKNASVSIQVTSTNGNLIKTINKGNISVGSYHIPLNMDNLSAGMYLVRLVVDDKAYSAAVVKE